MKTFLIISTLLLFPLAINAGVKMDPAIEGTALDFVERIISFILYFTALFMAPLLYLLAGLMFFTAAGEVEKTNQAKKIIFWTSLGLILILLAKGLMSYLKTIL